MSKTVRTGLIGLGAMGQSHARRILDGEVEGLELTAVCDADKDRLASFPGLAQYTQVNELLGSGFLDAVVIATPHYSHTDIGIAALEAGLHVLVEKPISVHKADCLRLIEAHKVRDSGQVFAAMFNQRTDPRYVKLKELIDSGELGALRRMMWVITDWFRTAAYYSSGTWRATWSGEGGGVLLNQSPHQLDLWQWLFGMPSALIADCQFGRFHDIEVEDAVTALLEYKDGARGVFVTTTGEAPGENRLTVVGDRGMVVVDEEGLRFTRTEVSVQEYGNSAEHGMGKPPVWHITIPTGSRGSQHLGILENFSAAVREGATLIAPAAEGLHSVELANAMLLSGFERRRVELPLDAAYYAEALAKRIAESPRGKK